MGSIGPPPKSISPSGSEPSCGRSSSPSSPPALLREDRRPLRLLLLPPCCVERSSSVRSSSSHEPPGGAPAREGEGEDEDEDEAAAAEACCAKLPPAKSSNSSSASRGPNSPPRRPPPMKRPRRRRSLRCSRESGRNSGAPGAGGEARGGPTPMASCTGFGFTTEDSFLMCAFLKLSAGGICTRKTSSSSRCRSKTSCSCGPAAFASCTLATKERSASHLCSSHQACCASLVPSNLATPRVGSLIQPPRRPRRGKRSGSSVDALG
mmetsp:Transcript_162939/g.522470  ORF Transcript_162939/g.522470 Transcript_162939/m.522470 type:complete len:265 (-) Transcript_162939:208-1002(-)